MTAEKILANHSEWPHAGLLNLMGNNLLCYPNAWLWLVILVYRHENNACCVYGAVRDDLDSRPRSVKNTAYETLALWDLHSMTSV